jgi:cytoplasmic iron level regulating protein YaaA (DUF328/UPF0246 family)
MLILLPPSETKREGGPGIALDVDALSFPSLASARREVLGALERLSVDDVAAARALKLGLSSAAIELQRNRTVTRSATMPAIERYTGVLYDALAVRDLGADARQRASRHIAVHSALFGLVRADDLIPAYRLSHDSRLTPLRLRAHWAVANAAVLAGHDAADAIVGPIVDLRSEGYASLGPLPMHAEAMRVRVVAVGADGVARALNHFNKKGKGEFVRALLQSGPLPESIDELCQVSTQLGWPLHRLRSSGSSSEAAAELQLTVPGVLPR